MRFAVGLCVALFIASIGSCSDDNPVKPLPKPIDTVAPFVTFIHFDSTNVDYSPSVIFGFSEEMDWGSINQNTCLLKKDTLTIPCQVQVWQFWNDDPFVSMDPISWLEFGTTYTIKITSGCKDLAGNKLRPEITRSFTTVPPSGRVRGFVTDYDLGDPVYGCTIVASTLYTAVTDNSVGEYEFHLLPIGIYTLTASQNIYTPSSKQVEVTPYSTTIVNFQLRTTEFGEPNDNFATATPISAAIPYSSYIRVKSDLDFFSFAANAGDTLLPVINSSPVPLWPQCDVYDPLHVWMGSSYPHTTMIAPMTGNYYVRFKGTLLGSSQTLYCNNNHPYEFIVYVREPTIGFAPESK